MVQSIEVTPEELSTGSSSAAALDASAAATRAGVRLESITDFEQLRSVSALLESVWGRSDEGVPINSDVLRGIVHAGGCVTCAYSRDEELVGAAALMPSVPSVASYSLIAAARAGGSDQGIGYAVKMNQRSWALQHGFTSMTWTFDPLVSRNARFNLVKLGAQAEVYEVAFYGQPSDDISGSDEADRLVARWVLGSARALAASALVADGPGADSEHGPPPQATLSQAGPDDNAMLARLDEDVWCRVPQDIISLRRSDPEHASSWRAMVRTVFTEAFADGLYATSISRDGWYRLTPKDDR
ncbi:MAG: hypothetical protein WBG57_05595 [Ornithinimicrobium sp.]